MKVSRAVISFRICLAICLSVSLNSNFERKARVSSTDMTESSWMLAPPTVTARASGRRRIPSQASQCFSLMKRSSQVLIPSLCVSM